MNKVQTSMNLRVGEWVEIKSAEEILASVDKDQCIDGLPFMPEMLQHCGKRFRVSKSAHKTADTIELFTIRRMDSAVHLGDLRCDGSAHGGCDAGCLLFWKEAWIKRVPDNQNAAQIPRRPESARAEALLSNGTTCSDEQGERYKCQATEMLKATTEVRRRERWDPLFYVKDLTSGNVKPFDFLRFGAFAMLNAFLWRWAGYSLPRIRGLANDPTPSQVLNLQPGDWVRVRSKSEIEKTLNRQLRNHGMWFDAEMLPFCGKGPYRVLKRVEKIVNEKTGKMIKLRDPSIILDGVTCSGNRLYRRMFSPRNEYPFWKEIWLERVPAAEVCSVSAPVREAETVGQQVLPAT